MTNQYSTHSVVFQQTLVVDIELRISGIKCAMKLESASPELVICQKHWTKPYAFLSCLDREFYKSFYLS